MMEKTANHTGKVLAVFVLILLCFFARMDVKAASSEQMDNLVVIYGISQGEIQIAADGLLVATDRGKPVVVTVATSDWDQMEHYVIVGPAIEEQEINLTLNDTGSGLTVFETDLEEGGCETSDMISYTEMEPNTVVYAAGLDINGSAEDGDAWEKEELTLFDSLGVDDEEHYYLSITPGVSTSFAGAPLITDDGRVAGILAVVDDDLCVYALSMDNVVGLISNDDSIDWLSGKVAVFLLVLIPVFGVIFLISCILYRKKQRSFRGNEQAEFANVLFLGGESGLQLLGVGGTFDGVKLPLEEKIIFGRDPSCCYAIYPEKIKDVSRLHCSVEVKKGQVILTDLNSSYGTFFGSGERLNPQTPYVLDYGSSFYIVEPKNTFKVV